MLGPLVIGRLNILLKFEPRDAWVGFFWDRYLGPGYDRQVWVYVCIVPFFPIKITWHLRHTGR